MTQSEIATINFDLIRNLLGESSPWQEKATAGSVAIPVPNAERLGAALLAARAVFRTGCQNVKLAVSPDLAPHAAVACPEATIVMNDDVSSAIDEQTILLHLAPSILTGTKAAAHVLLSENETPTTIGETRVLVIYGSSSQTEADVKPIAANSQRPVIVLGVATFANDGQGTTYKTEQAGLNLAGGTVVQAGIIASLLAQKLTDAQAIVIGAHLHALATEAVGKNLSSNAVLGRDLVEQLPGTLSYLRRTCDPKRTETRSGLRRS